MNKVTIVAHLTAPGIFLLPDYSNVGTLFIRPEVEIVWGSVSLRKKDKAERIEDSKNSGEDDEQGERGEDVTPSAESGRYRVVNPASQTQNAKRLRVTLKRN